MSVLEKRFAAAMVVYAVLFTLAFATLSGLVLKATALALTLFAVKTLIAFKAGK